MLSGYGPVLRLAAPVHPCAWGRFVGVGVALRCRGSSSCRRRRVIRHDITVSDIAIDRHVHDARRGPVGRAFVQARLPGRAVRARRGGTAGGRERPRVGPDRALPPSPGRASPDDVRLRVVHLLASPPPLDPRILFHPTPDGPPSQDTRIAPRDTTRYLLT